jgi:hypothetical protein
LKEHLDKYKEKFVEFNHSYYQGLLLEIGNMKGMSTYIPAQDKNKMFLNKEHFSKVTNKIRETNFFEKVKSDLNKMKLIISQKKNESVNVNKENKENFIILM